jgi:OOP family OmpA-OmpF porin
MTRKGWIAAMFFGAAATLGCGGALAQAQKKSDLGWYVSGSIGKNDDLDDELALKISGGYKFHPNIAVEFGYASLGEADPGFGVHAEAHAWELIGVFSYQLQNPWSIYGLLGFARIETKVSSPTPFFGFPGGTTTDTSTELTIGFGAQYDFSPKVGVRAQWQRYDTNNDIDVISLGVVYRF